MHLKTKSIVLLALVLLIALPLNAQRRRKKFDLMDGTRISPMVGINSFWGDLVDDSRTSYTFGASFEREMNNYLNARIHLMAGQMKGTQMAGESSDVVNAYFENNYIEMGFGATFRFVDLAYGYFKQRTFSSYVIGQVGAIYYDATEWGGPGLGNYSMLHPTKPGESRQGIWHQKTSIAPVATLGGGVTYWLSPRLSIRGEFLANKPITDELDAHKEWDDGDGNIHQTDAGDFYYTATVGVSYVIQDSRWKNEPKYNRKAYMKIRKYNMTSTAKRNKHKSTRPKRRR